MVAPGDNHDGPFESMHSKMDALGGKVDLINQQLIELRVRVELNAKQLEKVATFGERISRLEAQYVIIWAILTIILGVGAAILTKALNR